MNPTPLGQTRFQAPITLISQDGSLNFELLAGTAGASLIGSALLLISESYRLGIAFLGLIAIANVVAMVFLRNREKTPKAGGDEALLQILFDEAVDAVFLVSSAKGVIVNCNRRAVTLFEATHKNDLVGLDFKSLQKTLHPYPYAEILDHTRMQERWRAEIEYLSRRGWTFRGELVTREIRVGRMSYLLARISDLSERQPENHPLNQPSQVEKQERRGGLGFLPHLSQSLLSAANGMLHMMETLSHIKLPEKAQAALIRGHQAADVTLSLVNDIHDFCQIEAKQLTLESVNFNLRATIEKAVEGFTDAAKHKGVELLCLLTYDLPTALRGDPGRLRQLFDNLIENALAATHVGEVVVRGRVVSQSPSQVTLRFSVSDTGVGIAPDRLARLLASSSHASPSPDHSPSSVGIGLIRSKHLVTLMGGELGGESTVGRGTTFWFTATLDKQPPKALTTPPPRSSLQGLHALIVGNVQDLLSKQLVAWGTTNHCVTDPSQALQLLQPQQGKAKPYDIVIIDTQQLDRLELDLAEAIRATPTLSMLRLIVLITSGQKGDARRAHEAGFNAYLTKPVSYAQLFACLTTVMNQPPKTADVPLITRHTLAEAKIRTRPRVLVADAQGTDQKETVRLLKQLGYRVDVVNDGREAVAACMVNQYATVLIAFQLPEIDGLTASLEIRQFEQEKGGRTPIIALSATHRIPEKETYQRAGIDAVLVKPLRVEDVQPLLAHSVTTPKQLPQKMVLASSPTVQREVLNVTQALTQVGGDHQLFKEIVELFLSEYPKAMADIQQAITHHDPQTVIYTANTLRGSLSHFAATAAGEVALQLEHVGRRGDLSLAPTLIQQLAQELSRLETALTQLSSERAA